MFQTIIRTFLIYLFIFAAVKVMGKRELAELHPFEFVVLLIISDMASVAMQDAGIPLLSSIIPIITLTLLDIAMSSLSLKYPGLRRFFGGSPSVLIERGEIRQKELKKLRMSIDDLAEELRKLGYFEIGEVYYAVMETDGQVNAIPKAHAKPLTQEDLQMRRPQDKPAHILISDGIISDGELQKAGKDRAWLEKELQKRHIKSAAQVFIAELREGCLNIEEKDKKQ